MKNTPQPSPWIKPALVLVTSGLLGLVQSEAALTLHYNFESIVDVTADPVVNLVPGTDGVITNSGKVQLIENTIVTVGANRYILGKGLRFTSGDGDTLLAGHVNTGLTPAALGMVNGTTTNRPYTAMAWVNFANQTQDNMVFGQNQADGNIFHLGSRDANYHSGHWGDDVSAGTTKPNTWHHVAWINRADNQQEIYEDGVLVAGPGAGGTQGGLSTANMLIGTTGGSIGSLVGALDEVKIFGDVVMTPAQIQAERINGLPLYTLASVSSAKLDNIAFTFTLTDLGVVSVVNPATVTLEIDGAAVTPTSVNKAAGIITVIYNVPSIYLSASAHPYIISAKDQTNPAIPNITANGTLTAPVLPLVIPGPAGTPGTWKLREHRDGSIAGSTFAGINALAALAATDPEPADNIVFDGTVPVLNHAEPGDQGNRGNFNNDLPYIGHIEGVADNSIAFLGKTQLVVAAAGPQTFSIHSDDGFAFRISGGPSGNTSRFVSSNKNALTNGIDPADPQTIFFQGGTGDSATTGVYNFTAPGTYELLFVSVDGFGGSFFEVASAPGSFRWDRDTTTWTLVGNPNDPTVLAVPFSPRWITNVPGPLGEAGKFGIRTYFSANSVDNLQQTSDFLNTTVRTPEDGDNLTFDILRSSLNARDNGSTNAAQGVIPGDDLINGIPGAPQVTTPPGDQGNNRVVTVAKGRVTVPTSNFYTFWARGDDGFLLRIKAASGPNPAFKRASTGDPNQGAGRFEMSNLSELFFQDGTGDSDTRGIIFLAAGQYDLEYIQWEGTGGFWYELSAAEGEYPHGTEPSQGWKLVGYDGPAAVSVPGLAAPGWTVESSTPGRPEFVFTIAGAEAAIDATLADVTAPAAKTSIWPIINFDDPQSGGGGNLNPNNAWPLNTSADDNNYAMRATATLNITSAGTYNLGFQGDDGGYMDITGPGNPVWSSILETNHPAEATLTEAVPGSGLNNRLRVEVGTGNSRTLGTINLAVGSYTIKTLMYEGTGGSWWEIIGAKAPAEPQLPYPLLQAGPDRTVTFADVLLLVAPPAPETIPVTNFTYNPATGAFSLTFVSTASVNYQLEYSTTMEGGAAGTPEKWNIAPGLPTAGAAGTTTITGNISGLQTGAGGVLPAGAPRAFLRVRRL
jgi:Concanavalin A-like lectin/glucanases superfamily